MRSHASWTSSPVQVAATTTPSNRLKCGLPWMDFEKHRTKKLLVTTESLRNPFDLLFKYLLNIFSRHVHVIQISANRHHLFTSFKNSSRYRFQHRARFYRFGTVLAQRQA